MRARQIAELVLNEMQMLDQQVALPRALAEQCEHLIKRPRVDLAAFRRAARFATARPGAASGNPRRILHIH
jgi:hypothetical protein